MKVERNGRFLSGMIIPVYQGQDGLVRNDSLGRAIKKIRELVELDFPDNEVNVSADGKIFYK
jgi:hypothetical protein